MKLGETAELILGVVIEANDPKHLGRVKVAASGWFDMSVMALEAIPWVYPFMGLGGNSVSHIELGAKVWLLINKENEEEYWYIPYPSVASKVQDVSNPADDLDNDTLLSRDLGSGAKVEIYQNKSDGVVIRNMTSEVTLNNNGEIIVCSNATENPLVVKIAGGKVFIGNGNEEFQPVVLGKQLQEILSQLSSDFSAMAIQCNCNPYTGSLYKPFDEASKHIDDKIVELNSETVLISK